VFTAKERGEPAGAAKYWYCDLRLQGSLAVPFHFASKRSTHCTPPAAAFAGPPFQSVFFSFRKAESCALSLSPIRKTVIIISTVVNRHSKNEKHERIVIYMALQVILCVFQKESPSKIPRRYAI
jgi:hypothetical protein